MHGGDMLKLGQGAGAVDQMAHEIGYITYGGERIHYALTFWTYADRLGQERSAAWKSNLHVGLNHGCGADRDYLIEMLDRMTDEYEDSQR
jgi:hypothetical protein